MKQKLLIIFFSIFLLIPIPIISAMYSKPQPRCCHCEAEPVLSRIKNPHYNPIVFELQQYWAAFSVYQGKPNGLFDEQMEQTVINFQKKHHLNICGTVNQETWQAIGRTPSISQTAFDILPSGTKEILVDLNALSLTVLINNQPFRSFPVAIGKVETPSPIGSWIIANKGYWVKGKTKWLGLSVPYGIYGIHGTNQPWSIGKRASNGCIRMYNQHLDLIYQWIRPGTHVHIIGDPFRDRRLLKRGLIGSDVYFLQVRLKQLGFFKNKANGVYDYWTEAAVKRCQQQLNLPITGEISPKEYYRLRLYPTD